MPFVNFASITQAKTGGGGGGGGGGGNWTPASLASTPILWLDAQTTSTLTTSSNLVSSWASRGTGATASNTAGNTTRPVFDATALNSLPGVKFTNANNTRLLLPNGFLNGRSAFTVVMVMSAPSSPAQNNNAVFGSAGGSTGFEMLFFGAPYIRLNQNAGQQITGSLWSYGPGVSPVASISVITYRSGTGNSLTVWRDGSTTTAAATLPNPVALDAVTTYAIGSYFSATTYNATMTMGELIFIPTDVDTTNRRLLEGYAAHRWGLSSLLPANHPYKSSAP